MQPAEKTADLLSFEDIKALARDDMGAVDDLIRSSLQSDVLLVSQVAEYIVTSGGKRLRPLIVLLAARALGNTGGHRGADNLEVGKGTVEVVTTSTQQRICPFGRICIG